MFRELGGNGPVGLTVRLGTLQALVKVGEAAEPYGERRKEQEEGDNG